MERRAMGKAAMLVTVVAVLVALGASSLLAQEGDRATAVAGKSGHVAEVRAALAGLTVDEPRTHKNMIVFPIRWGGKQVGGDWTTMDDAVASGELKVTEKAEASVPSVRIENTGSRTVLLMSGEIVKGGKQTRVVRTDTVVEARQKVDVPVFCVEQGRWAGGASFKASSNMAPAEIQEKIKRGAGQGEVWREVRRYPARLRVNRAVTGNLDEVLDSDEVKEAQKEARDDLGNFSPPDTIGLAFADARTGRVVGLELFGCRHLFARLQDKLIEGYTTDLVISRGKWDGSKTREVTRKDVERTIRQAIDGTSRYEDTAGSGRGIDLTAGTLKGKGVALGEHGIHLSIQDLRPVVTPARPIIEENTRPSSER